MMRRHCWPAYRELLRRSPWPILVGPFRSEVGFEALYWLPFVQALGIDPSRLIPVSRGGAAIWYGAPHGVELYDLREPKDVRIANYLEHAKTGMLKQNRVTAFDRALIKDAAKAAGLTRYHVLHPAWMYQVLAPFWEGRTGLEWLWPHITRQVTKPDGTPGRTMEYQTVPDLPAGLTLPPRFTAARFYYRATFPNSDLTQALARAALKQIAEHQPVILLNSGVHADEHIDVDVSGIPNVTALTDLCAVDPRMNLALQSAVLARAQGFIGTYGGLAQLALRLGKPSLSYFLDWQGTALAHHTLSHALSLQTGVSFLTVKIGDIPVLKTLIPEIAWTAKPAVVAAPEGELSIA